MQCKNASLGLKEVCWALVLRLPDKSPSTGPSVLDTDTNDVLIGEVFSNLGKDVAEHVTVYGGRRLSNRTLMLTLVSFFLIQHRHHLIS